MAYELYALLGNGAPPSEPPVALQRSLWLLPTPEATELTERLAGLAAELSQRQYVAFVEAEYFSGSGSQKATVWHRGEVVAAEATINEALRLLGVTREGDMDEFDSAGLGRHRRTERWLEVSSGPRPGPVSL